MATLVRARTMLAAIPQLNTAAILTRQILRLVPTATKYLAFLLLLLNATSLPGAWHLRVFSSVISLHVHLRLLKLRTLFLRKADRDKALLAWFEGRMPIGVNPFRRTLRYTSSVRIDDADFNMHMSNSSYAKTLDTARFEFALVTFLNVFHAGGWVPLGATHYHFIREIPVFARYEIQTVIGAWDDKWMWLVHRFVTRPSKKSSKSKSGSTLNPVSKSTDAQASTAYSGDGTPVTRSASNIPTLSGTPRYANGAVHPSADSHANGNSPQDISRALLDAALKDTQAQEDGVLCTIAISQLCFKQGRITIPPSIVLASNGFYAPATSSSAPLPTDQPDPSSASPTHPPYWPLVRALALPKPRALGAFYAGGWRTVPEGERWWEGALAGMQEELRARVRVFEKGKEGFEVVRGMR